MNVVYEPKGRALEYSPLACNLYMGCPHACKYCFAPACMRKKPEQWHSCTTPRRNVVELFRRDAEKLRGDKRKILFSFLSDPYQPKEAELHLTRQVLEIVQFYRLKSQVLTKGLYEIIFPDLPLMKQAGTELGITLCFVEDTLRKVWEPAAATVQERMAILKEAHSMGIYTWVSLEPVIDPEQALEVIRQMSPYVDFWKVGKLNHWKEEEDKVDWFTFKEEAETLLQHLGVNYYIKNDLRHWKPSLQKI